MVFLFVHFNSKSYFNSRKVKIKFIVKTTGCETHPPHGHFYCLQLGLSMADLELLTIRLVNDMFAELQRDDEDFPMLPTQEDFDAF